MQPGGHGALLALAGKPGSPSLSEEVAGFLFVSRSPPSPSLPPRTAERIAWNGCRAPGRTPTRARPLGRQKAQPRGLPVPRRRRGECPGSSCRTPCLGLGREAGQVGVQALGLGVRGGCLPCWVGGGPSGEVTVGPRARLFPGPSLSGLPAPWRLKTRYPPKPLPQWGVCEARRWDRDKAAPTSLVLGLGDEPGGRKINYPTSTPENPFVKLTRCVTPISMPRRTEICWLAAGSDTPRASRARLAGRARGRSPRV